MTQPEDSLPKRCDWIFIWSRGGSGHKAVMEAKKEEWEQKGYSVVDYDILGDHFINKIKVPFMGKMGNFCANLWDNAQQSGNIILQKLLANLHWVADILFYPIVYRNFKKILSNLETPLEGILVTQAICNTAIARAVRNFNREKGWNVKLDIWMSDLPTEKAKHFFSSIRKISMNKTLSPFTTLYAPPPYLEEGEDDKKWWRKNCGNIRVITDQPFPIRQTFLEQESLIGKEVKLFLQHASSPEIQSFHIQKEDKVATLMLGSRPSRQAVLDYVAIMIKLAKKEKDVDKDYFFFVFCGGYTTYNRLQTAIEKKNKTLGCPAGLRIVPFCFQSDRELAPLLARSDLTLTKSGGSTSMELLHLNKDKKGITLIHSESYKKKTFSFFEKFGGKKILPFSRPEFKYPLSDSIDAAEDEISLSKGIVLWEVGNAEYLQQKIEAQVVTPNHVEDVLSSVFFTEQKGPSSPQKKRILPIRANVS